MQCSMHWASDVEGRLRLLVAVDGVLIEIGRDHRVEVLGDNRIYIWVMSVVDESCCRPSRPQASAVILLKVLG